MADLKKPIIAYEGRLLVAISIILLLLLHAFWGMAVVPLWAPVIALMWMLRDPARQVPAIPLGVISPIDGLVTDIKETTDPFRNDPAIRISVRMNLSGAYTLRSPIEGKIMEHWFNQADSALPYEHSIWIKTDEGDDLLVALYRGRLFGKIGCYISTGERVGQGQRCGYIPLGTRADIFIPQQSQLEVQVSDRVYAGETVVSKLIHE